MGTTEDPCRNFVKVVLHWENGQYVLLDAETGRLIPVPDHPSWDGSKIIPEDGDGYAEFLTEIGGRQYRLVPQEPALTRNEHIEELYDKTATI